MERLTPMVRKPKFSDGMTPCPQGEFVRLSEAQAEIARLTAEVERLQDAYQHATEKRIPVIRDTAWNEAIEAAASIEVDGYGELHPMHSYAIRAILRPT